MKIMMTIQAGRVARTGQRKCIRVLVKKKNKGKRRLGGTKRRWEDFIKM